MWEDISLHRDIIEIDNKQSYLRPYIERREKNIPGKIAKWCIKVRKIDSTKKNEEK